MFPGTLIGVLDFFLSDSDYVCSLTFAKGPHSFSLKTFHVIENDEPFSLTLKGNRG